MLSDDTKDFAARYGRLDALLPHLGGVGGGNQMWWNGPVQDTGSSGGGAAANVTQPTLVCNVLMKL